jgi:outer membrane protein TolC
VAEAEAQLADLTAQRTAISQQLGATKAQLTQLLSIVEAPAESASESPAGSPDDEPDEQS